MRKVGNLSSVPTNITEAWHEMAEALAAHKAGHIKAETAKEIANLGGKLIKAVAVQCEYAALRKEKPDLPHAK